MKGKVKSRFSVLLFLINLLLILYSFTLLMILIWGTYNAFKDGMGFDFADNPLSLPTKWHFENINTAMKSMKVAIEVKGGTNRNVRALEMYGNTVLYAGGSAIMVTITPCIVSYLVSKYGKKFKILDIYTSIVIVCLSIPIVGSTASELQIAIDLGLKDKIWGQWFMKSYFIGLYYLVFYSTFNGIPDSFMEAAKIDGAGNFSILIKIMLPLVKNTFLTIFLIRFIEFWNDYQTPLLFIPNKPTISYGLYRFGNSNNADLSNVTMQLMGCLIVLVPILVVFIFFQKRIMGNITMGGVKE